MSGERSLAGLRAKPLLLVRKINAGWPRHDLLREARATEAPAKSCFFKQKGDLFNDCISSQAGRQLRQIKGDKRKAQAKEKGLWKYEHRIGVSFKSPKLTE